MTTTQVVSLLTDGTESLPTTVATAPFWKRLTGHKHDFKLEVPNVFNPDGEAVSIKANLRDKDDKDVPEVRKVLLRSRVAAG